ncbi:MAG TPA: phosphate regulon sensor histidine kinase PhoR [Ramlibacter sp.]|uniref:phosphate regulon sensor histidine kinase PhoR n=1 Tax=Ramlibacter sp. TaxID=1917967 RepID=UPI002D7F2457|nr:phosphate regulon sensor histidine kinase PhoR [Ramlibacter sp.]HET8745522.1 phosphate regulon sensor histidine kinase PhoR [Ramlibacter sp.]
MSARAFAFALSLALGALVGWLLESWPGATLGMAAGAAAWFAVDTLAASRVLRWLDAGQLRGAPAMGGVWGRAAARARRALAAREERAEDAERRLEAFLDAIRSSPNGVVLLDGRGCIEWFNQTAATHLGLDAQRDLQQQVVNLLRDPRFAAFYHAGNYNGEVVIDAPRSTPARPRRLALHVHPYGEGKRLLLSRDVTEVEQAERMRRDFVANVSHEIRTPLTVLSGFVETLQTLELPAAERERYLGMMAQQAERMQMLVADLLTLSRLEGSPPPGEGEWVAAQSLVAQCEQEARALATVQAKTLRLAFEAAPDMALSGAPGELQSALSNLVSNAVRYTPSGGTVQVRAASTPGGGAVLSVRDSGPGIPPEHLPRLTERFYRVDRSRSRESGGTGLGLAIVKHVVQRHGGELRIDSAPGQGSTFTIALPPARVRVQAQAGTTMRAG